jgi:2-dehydropantoate 2-reductase
VRFVVLGAGAIGSVVGGRLARHGHRAVLVARGAHLAALRAGGLRLESPEGADQVAVPAVGSVAEAGPTAEDVVLLAVKSQDTVAAVAELAAAASTEVPVFCLQNGVANEHAVLRRFRNVHGVAVMCPAVFLDPGTVQAFSSPVPGVLDLGRWPCGSDGTSTAVSAALSAAGFASRVRDDIERLKHGKLLSNLGNALEVVCGPAARRGPVGDLARAEGEACLQAAGIEVAEDEDDRRQLLQLGEIGGQGRPGGSTWQSVRRGAASVEVDYLNGEVVLLGRLHGVPTPVNERLQALCWQAVRQRRQPLLTEDDFLAGLPAPTGR